jgi:hypothetical protein
MKTDPLTFFRTLPLPAQAFIILWVVFVFAMPCAFFSSITGYKDSFACLGAIFVVMMLCTVLLMAMNLYSAARSGGFRKAMEESWKKSKSVMDVDPSLELGPGERIVFPATQCYIKESGGVSYGEYPRDVIVTNRRIVPGFYTSILIFEQKETFGQMNFWHPKIGQIPKTSVLDALGANTVIKTISCGSDKDGDYVDLQLDYAIPNSFRIYHPEAKRIFGLFSK